MFIENSMIFVFVYLY